MVVRARVTEDIRRDTVMILHGFWQGCEELGLPGYSLFDGGANPNNLSTQIGRASCRERV